MHARRTLLSLVGLAVVGLALVAGCSSNHSGGAAQSLMGPNSRSVRAANGLTLMAEPMHIFINTNDPATPTDPDHGDERYGTAILSLIATDPDGNPQADLDVTFASTAGTLASAGVTRKTDAEGAPWCRWPERRPHPDGSDRGLCRHLHCLGNPGT